jgi:hypothetical protein
MAVLVSGQGSGRKSIRLEILGSTVSLLPSDPQTFHVVPTT